MVFLEISSHLSGTDSAEMIHDLAPQVIGRLTGNAKIICSATPISEELQEQLDQRPPLAQINTAIEQCITLVAQADHGLDAELNRLQSTLSLLGKLLPPNRVSTTKSGLYVRTINAITGVGLACMALQDLVVKSLQQSERTARQITAQALDILSLISPEYSLLYGRPIDKPLCGLRALLEHQISLK